MQIYMHVASPFPIKVSNDRQKLVPAAKDGTLRVLKASINAGVDQIILTSSIVAMFRKPNRTSPYSLEKMIGLILIGKKVLVIIFCQKQLQKKRVGIYGKQRFKRQINCY